MKAPSDVNIHGLAALSLVTELELTGLARHTQLFAHRWRDLLRLDYKPQDLAVAMTAEDLRNFSDLHEDIGYLACLARVLRASGNLSEDAPGFTTLAEHLDDLAHYYHPATRQWEPPVDLMANLPERVVADLDEQQRFLLGAIVPLALAWLVALWVDISPVRPT